MRTQMFFFLLFIAIFLFSVHFFVFVSLAKMFPVFVSAHRGVLMGTLIFLSIAFVLAMTFVHMGETPLSRAFYFLAGEWLGLLTNIVLALVLLWVIMGLAKIVSLDVPIVMLGIFFLGLSVLVSLYGSWNAFHPRLREISVRIPDLPEVWQGKKIVQISDVHLGSIYRQDFLRGVVAQINTVQPEAVMITGDLFDGMDGVLDDIIAPLDDIQSRQGVFFVTGNHETYLGVDEIFASLRKMKVVIVDNAVIDLAGLKLIGISYPPRGTADEVSDELALLRPAFAGQPNVLLYHSPTHIEAFREAGVNLQLSGHTHKGQQFPFGLITSYIYDGFDYGLHEMGDYAIYTTNGVGTWGPTMRIGNIPEIVVITLEKK